MKTRPAPMMTAAPRKMAPTRRSKRKTVKAIAKAALAWSLGKEASWERLPQTWADGCVAKGRCRCQIFPISWLIRSARAAEASAEPEASFHLRLPPGRAKEPEREGGDGDRRHGPAFKQVESASEPGVVVDELVDGVVDPVVHDVACGETVSEGQWVIVTASERAGGRLLRGCGGALRSFAAMSLARCSGRRRGAG
jgi:hypothetical protein